VIFHKFDRIIRPGFIMIAPFLSARQFINSSMQSVHASVRRAVTKRVSNVPPFNLISGLLTSVRKISLEALVSKESPKIVEKLSVNSEHFARNPVLLARPQKFALHQILRYVSSSEITDITIGGSEVNIFLDRF
jgi:hypothetical protein